MPIFVYFIKGPRWQTPSVKLHSFHNVEGFCQECGRPAVTAQLLAGLAKRVALVPDQLERRHRTDLFTDWMNVKSLGQGMKLLDEAWGLDR